MVADEVVVVGAGQGQRGPIGSQRDWGLRRGWCVFMPDVVFLKASMVGPEKYMFFKPM